jgi:hypothetical protein
VKTFRAIAPILVALCFCSPAMAASGPPAPIEWIDQYGDKHPDKDTRLAKSSSRAERKVSCRPIAVHRQRRPWGLQAFVGPRTDEYCLNGFPRKGVEAGCIAHP